jgi:hypothetical protein
MQNLLLLHEDSSMGFKLPFSVLKEFVIPITVPVLLSQTKKKDKINHCIWFMIMLLGI